jgi:hypothetical protein
LKVNLIVWFVQDKERDLAEVNLIVWFVQGKAKKGTWLRGLFKLAL